MIDLLQRLERLQPTVAGWMTPLPMRQRLLYAVNHSYPFSSNGYAVRTHGVASALVRAGVDVIAASRPGLPWDRVGFKNENFPKRHQIDGVHYEHRSSPSRVGMPLADYLNAVVRVWAFYLSVFRPNAVLAASNWENALPVAIAAREAGVPFFYEVRGFWEISQVSRDPAWMDSAGFRAAVACETAVARAADRVFSINRQMRAELIRRGVAEDRVDLVPNGFASWPAPSASSVINRDQLSIRAQFVVGYIGSFSPYEGLEDLIEAVGQLRGSGVDVVLVLVGSSARSAGMDKGDCRETGAYRNLAQRLNLGNGLVLPGRVMPDQIGAYYALLDVVVIPRRPFAVCEIVSPMKPLEAAAHGKRVLMSDVEPLADLAGLCPNFSYFAKGDVVSLTDRLGELLTVGNFAPRHCEALEGLTWDSNVAPILSAIRAPHRNNR
jgi:glycosyltransferase involved in cell wall biosynthesis